MAGGFGGGLGGFLGGAFGQGGEMIQKGLSAAGSQPKAGPAPQEGGWTPSEGTGPVSQEGYEQPTGLGGGFGGVMSGLLGNPLLIVLVLVAVWYFFLRK